MILRARRPRAGSLRIILPAHLSAQRRATSADLPERTAQSAPAAVRKHPEIFWRTLSMRKICSASGDLKFLGRQVEGDGDGMIGTFHRLECVAGVPRLAA